MACDPKRSCILRFNELLGGVVISCDFLRPKYFLVRIYNVIEGFVVGITSADHVKEWAATVDLYHRDLVPQLIPVFFVVKLLHHLKDVDAGGKLGLATIVF